MTALNLDLKTYSFHDATELKNWATGEISLHSQAIQEIVVGLTGVDEALQIAIAHQTPDSRAHLSNKCVELAHVLGGAVDE